MDRNLIRHLEDKGGSKDDEDLCFNTRLPLVGVV